jgi:predicted dehydrogenase
MSKQQLNVAMIGSGFIAKAHSNAFHQVGRFFPTPFECRLKVLCGRNRAKLEGMSSQWGWEEINTDWRDVVSRQDVQVVDIAVPNALHAPIAIAAAEAGKMVLCEKPLAVSLEQAERMAKTARHLPNMVWFNYRRVPAIAFSRKLVEEGRVGEPYHYRSLYLNQSGNDPAKASGWRYQRAEAGSGATGDLLAHLIDTALYLNGPITQLLALTHTFFPSRDVDDAVMFICHFANGSLGSFEATRYGIGCRNRNAFEINGSKGMLRFDLDDMNWLEFVDATEAPRLQASRKILVTGPDHPYWQNFWKPGHIIGYEHTFIAALGDFLASLEGNEPFHPNFEDAVRVQRVLDAVERSAKSRSWVTFA